MPGNARGSSHADSGWEVPLEPIYFFRCITFQYFVSWLRYLICHTAWSRHSIRTGGPAAALPSPHGSQTPPRPPLGMKARRNCVRGRAADPPPSVHRAWRPRRPIREPCSKPRHSPPAGQLRLFISDRAQSSGVKQGRFSCAASFLKGRKKDAQNALRALVRL